MIIDVTELRRELAAVRKGRGLQHSALLRRIGPSLRALCGIDDHDTAAVAREKIVEKVEQMLADEPPELLIAALAAFAAHRHLGGTLATLGEREVWLANKQRYQPRTARRRIDEALDAMARAVASSQPTASAVPSTGPDNWWIRSLVGVLRLGRSTGAELTERRRITFARDGVAELFCEFGLPRSEPSADRTHELEIEVTDGGEITTVRRPTREHFQYVVALPRRFRAGESHDYSIHFRIPPGQPIAPHYVLQPFVPCDAFQATVCFDRSALPELVWQLSGAAPMMAASAEPVGPILVPDRLGEVRCFFRSLAPGRTYGVRWRPAP